METTATALPRAADAREPGAVPDTPGDPPVHPVAALFPLMEGEEFEAHKRSIAELGQIDDITVLGGVLLDGRNRLRACRSLGIEPRFAEWGGA